MILLDTDTFTLHQFGHERVSERIGAAREIPAITIITRIGTWKDDPDIEQIVEEALRARGRPLMEDGTYSAYKRK